MPHGIARVQHVACVNRDPEDATAGGGALRELTRGRIPSVQLAPLATEGNASIAQQADVFGMIDPVEKLRHRDLHIASFGNRLPRI